MCINFFIPIQKVEGWGGGIVLWISATEVRGNGVLAIIDLCATDRENEIYFVSLLNGRIFFG
jgi:hypothetical protein